MKKSKYLQKVVKKLVDLSFKDGKVIEQQVTKSIKALKILPKYQAIEGLSEYVKELKRLERAHTMYIETVIPLNAIQIRKIKKIVAKKAMPAGRQVKITKVVTRINLEILGGFILKVGDEVWDQSFTDKINQIQEAITHGNN